MKTTTTILALSIAAITTWTFPLRADDSKSINPALLYWQAASELPQHTSDQAKELRDLAAGRRPFDATIAAKNLTEGKSALRLARKAADSASPCDWGLPMEDGPFTLLPHISKMQEMASLAIVQAEALFAEGKTADGLQWLIVAHRMARDAGAGDLLISNLVQFAIETNALRAAARHCLAWDENTRHSYAAQLQTLPPLHTTQAAYGNERVYIDWVDRKFSEGAEAATEVQRMLKEQVEGLLKSSGLKVESMDKDALAAQFAPAGVKAALPDLRSLENRTEAVLGQPWPQCRPKLEALADEAAHSPHLLVRSNYPGILSVAEKQFIIATLRTMLGAALAHGTQLDAAAAATYKDAIEGDPLRLQKAVDGTLSLATAHQHPAGKDLTLPLGK